MSRANPHIGDTIVYEHCDLKGRWRWGLGVVVAFPGPSAAKITEWQRQDVQQLIHQREQELSKLNRSGKKYSSSASGSPVSPHKNSFSSTTWGAAALVSTATAEVEDLLDYEVLNAAFDTTWVETDSQTSVLLKSIICNLGALSVTPRTGRGAAEGESGGDTINELKESSSMFMLDPMTLVVKSIQLSEDAATIIEKAVARASDWSTCSANMVLSSSAKDSSQVLPFARSDSSRSSDSYGSCMGETIGNTANPFKMKLNLGQTAAPVFKLNLPVTDAKTDEGYIALPPPTARQDMDSLGGTLHDNDMEDLDTKKWRAKAREYEEQIESLIEQVETLRGSRGGNGDSGSGNGGSALNGSGGLGFSQSSAVSSATPRASALSARKVSFQPEGGIDAGGPADPQAIALLKKQLKEQRLNYDRQVSDLRLKNEEQTALINAWKVVVDSAKTGIVGADGMKTARLNIHTARGNIQTARQQYRMTARNRSARENADAEAQLEAAEGMLDLQESVRNFITNTHESVEVSEINGTATPRLARARMGSSSPLGLPTVPSHAGSPHSPSQFTVTSTHKTPTQVVVPTSRPTVAGSPKSEKSPPTMVVTPPAATHVDPTAFPSTPTPPKSAPLQGRATRKGLGAKAKPKMASNDLHSQFQNCCNLLRESAMTAELSAEEERQRNTESAQRIRAMVEELESMKKLRDQEQKILKVQLDRLKSGRPICKEVGVQAVTK